MTCWNTYITQTKQSIVWRSKLTLSVLLLLCWCLVNAFRVRYCLHVEHTIHGECRLEELHYNISILWGFSAVTSLYQVYVSDVYDYVREILTAAALSCTNTLAHFYCYRWCGNRLLDKIRLWNTEVNSWVNNKLFLRWSFGALGSAIMPHHEINSLFLSRKL